MFGGRPCTDDPAAPLSWHGCSLCCMNLLAHAHGNYLNSCTLCGGTLVGSTGPGLGHVCLLKLVRNRKFLGSL